jgi:hypothetical protein
MHTSCMWAKRVSSPTGSTRRSASHAALSPWPASVVNETAHDHYRQAIALATELGMRPLVAHCHLGLGKLRRRTGDGAKAAEHLMTARRMYREMDMGFWLEQVEAACAGGGP